MSQESRHPVQIIKDWWGVVLVVVGILGGYIWLEQNFARITKLDVEKCSLSYEIRRVEAGIEFDRADEKIDIHQSELEALLKQPDTIIDQVKFKEKFIASLHERVKEINARQVCLTKAKNQCFQNDVDTEKCYKKNGDGG